MRYRVAHDSDYIGVIIHPSWDDFEVFLKDMGECPEGMSLDRIENSAGYAPGNCRWTTMKVQQNNRTNNVVLEFQGKKQTLALWAEELKLNVKTVYSRYARNKDPSYVLSTAVRPWSRWHKKGI